MHLRCTVCQATQQVGSPDPEDEDARTQGIRRTFRAEHVAACGGRVVFELHGADAITIDPEAWDRYLSSVDPVGDVALGGDGYFYRTIQRDGHAHHARVCEDCWQTIPRYIDFPAGLVSPETEGASGRTPKLKPSTVDTESPARAAALAHLFKAVCLPCYLAAFARVYPGAPLPALSADLHGDGAPVTPEASPVGLGQAVVSLPKAG